MKTYDRGRSIPSDSDLVTHIPSINHSIDFKDIYDRHKKPETSFDLHNDTPSLIRAEFSNSPAVLHPKVKEVAASSQVMLKGSLNKKIREISLESKSVVAHSVIHHINKNGKNSLSPKGLQSSNLSRKLSAD